MFYFAVQDRNMDVIIFDADLLCVLIVLFFLLCNSAISKSIELMFLGIRYLQEVSFAQILCWDHTLFLALEDATPSVWLTPTR